MATIHVDNQPYTVADGQNLLQACLGLGFDLPYFCWHPALHSVGACRQCAVKQFRDEHDTRGRIVMACMTPAAEGTRISIHDPEVRAFRAAVIEWLMINHPHDCPVCDEGGECHLQDMTVMTGHVARKYHFTKRTYRNQYLGPFVNHEMNRCIQCYRCVRFYRDYAGGHDLVVTASHDDVYFGRDCDGTLESEFSGNLVEVCPTGVFTDATLKRHYTRKWDLETTPSICMHCSLGCNIIPGARHGVLRRIQNRFHSEVNSYFICDRGRYGYEFVNGARRIRTPIVRSRAGSSIVDWSSSNVDKSDALRGLGTILSSNRLVGIGSPRASLEANFALRKLVGAERYCLGLSASERRSVDTVLAILRQGPAHLPSLREVESCDAVFVLGEDVINTAPRLALSLRQSIRRQPQVLAEQLGIPYWDDAAAREAAQARKGPLFIATVHSTKLDEIATATYHAAPDDLARLGFAVADALAARPQAPLSQPEETVSFARSVAQALREAQRPLIVSGTGSANQQVLWAAANIASALCATGRPANLCYAVPECNSFGVGLMGGADLASAFRAVQAGAVDTIIVLENDLYRRADAVTVDSFLAVAKHVIAIDCIATATTDRADFVLPAGTFAESDGTLVSNEGRAQRFYQAFVPEGDIQESWRWLRDVALVMGRGDVASWQTLDDIITDTVAELPELAGVADAAPPASFRVLGMKIPRQSSRYSGRTAMHAAEAVSEPKPPDDPDSALAFSMEGFPGQPPSPLITRFRAPGWNSVQAVAKYQTEVGGALRGGGPGRRLIQPMAAAMPSFGGVVPDRFERRHGQLLLVPFHHIFGSEELSILSPAIAERAPQPYLALNPKDALELHLDSGIAIWAALGGRRRQLIVTTEPTLPEGVAGVPAGLPNMVGIELPVWIDAADIDRSNGKPGAPA